jgi:hypothetical protein
LDGEAGRERPAGVSTGSTTAGRTLRAASNAGGTGLDREFAQAELDSFTLDCFQTEHGVERDCFQVVKLAEILL